MTELNQSKDRSSIRGARISRAAFVDVMIVTPDRDKALKLARLYGQDSEWEPDDGWDSVEVNTQLHDDLSRAVLTRQPLQLEDGAAAGSGPALLSLVQAEAALRRAEGATIEAKVLENAADVLAR